MKTQEIIKICEDYVMPTYARTPGVFVRGRGLRIWDVEGKEYLDFFPGWAVSGLGHCHPRIVAALKTQAKKIIHVPNNYYNILQGKLAHRISQASFDGKVFFSNSGAEANEAALKLARMYGGPGRYEVITMEDSFHGRTLATITATAQTKYKEGFEPLLEGFKHVPFNDITAARDAITDKTVAIMIEPIQGEGGINIASKDYIRSLRGLCTEHDILLVFDEIQTGMGRTGKFFCYQHYDIEPDVMTLAKTLGGGVPIGATIAKRKIADTLKPGTHASTFGGSPIVCASALAAFEAIEKEGLLSNANKMGGYLFTKLDELKKKHPVIKEVRGMGLMVGIELAREGKPVVEGCFERRLLINCTRQRVLRLMPPLTVKKKDIDKAIGILDEVFRKVTSTFSQI